MQLYKYDLIDLFAKVINIKADNMIEVLEAVEENYDY